MRRRRWPAVVPLLLLAGVCAGLAWQVRRELDTPPPAPLDPAAESTAESTARATEIPPAPDFDPPPARAFDLVVARNLFAADRQPPPVEDDGGAAPARATLDLTLTGVVLSDRLRVAILSDPRTREVVRLSPGQNHRGWTLVRLDARSATFARDKREVTLDLQFAGEGGAAGRGDVRATGRGNPQQAQRTRSEYSVQPRRTDSQGNPIRARRQNTVQDRLQQLRD